MARLAPAFVLHAQLPDIGDYGPVIRPARRLCGLAPGGLAPSGQAPIRWHMPTLALAEARLQVQRCRLVLRGLADQKQADEDIAAATRATIDRSWGLIARVKATPGIEAHAEGATVPAEAPAAAPAPAARNPSTLVNRNVFLASGKTSMRLDPEYWDAIRDICAREGVPVSQVVDMAVRNFRQNGGRTCAVRAFVINYFRAHATEAGHLAAGHGRLA